MEEATTPVHLPQGEGEAEQKPVPCEKLTGYLGHPWSQEIDCWSQKGIEFPDLLFKISCVINSFSVINSSLCIFLVLAV